MGLTEYKKKRSFNKTPEPKGAAKSANGVLHFVVQKHAASRLHYDFRLEMKGVLKSWAVPKGPSLNPEDKRLAMMVEDHPYEYKDFEGIIPPGNYGAGTVIVWDEGTYEAMLAPDADVKEQEKELLRELHKGDVKIVLHGQKLKGAFALVHIKGKEVLFAFKHIEYDIIAIVSFLERAVDNPVVHVYINCCSLQIFHAIVFYWKMACSSRSSTGIFLMNSS